MTTVEAKGIGPISPALQERLDRGEQIVGIKLNRTGTAWGWLTDAMELTGEDMPLRPGYRIRIEAEIAFVLDKPLQGSDLTVEDVMAATAEVRAGLEIPADPIVDGEPTILKGEDYMADNASALYWRLGEPGPADVDPATVPVTVVANGVEIGAGPTDKMPHPAVSVAAAAASLDKVGGHLPAGLTIFTADRAKWVGVEPGSVNVCDFGPLGSLTTLGGPATA